MRVIKGDLVQMALMGDFDLIVHGCNCFNTMGAGIARQIALTWPVVRRVDARTIKGDRAKLGAYTRAVTTLANGNPLVIVNAYTQYGYGRGGPHFSLEALKSVFNRLAIEYPTYRIGLPRIGSGLGGGDPVEVESLLRTHFNTLDLTIVDYGG